jgi:bacillithiol biosynthesis cysteine-adding enzyme BshC
MIHTQIPYQNLRYFSPLIKDYLSQNDALKQFYDKTPNVENFKKQVVDKQQSSQSVHSRKILRDSLLAQYADVPDASHSLENIDLLQDENTFTITTGHQLNLFTGPLYFIYKIVSTLNLCAALKSTYPEFNFVPIYWMATEDHDFEEIQYFNFKDRKLVFEKNVGGAVGRLSTEGLEMLKEQLAILLGATRYADDLIQLFEHAYSQDNLAQATRLLTHSLFGKDGLVIIDGDHKELKNLMIPFFKEELIENTCYHAVSDTIRALPDEYQVQVNPREINLFYLTESGRHRIIKRDGVYYLDGQQHSFTEKEIITLLDQYPERFSPNVLLRPLYQEVILPNLAYIGGGGEIAYWLQLKDYFKTQNISFPILLLRNSALLVSNKKMNKLENLDLKIEDLFLENHELEKKIVKQVSRIEIDFGPQKAFLKKQFQDLYKIAAQTDPSFEGAVAAQERKQIKGLENLEKRLLKAQKRKWKDRLQRAQQIKNDLFPGDSLQERHANFSYFYKDYGPELIDAIKSNLDPLDSRFTVIKL